MAIFNSCFAYVFKVLGKTGVAQNAWNGLNENSPNMQSLFIDDDYSDNEAMPNNDWGGAWRPHNKRIKLYDPDPY